MPRQNINRSFRALAESQNRKEWGDLPAPRSALEAACVPEFEQVAHRQQAAYLSDRRVRLVARISETIEAPRLFWDHRYFRHLPGSVLETDEAVTKLRSALAREVSRCRAGHWSANPARVVELREAMVFARFFRMHGRKVWLADRRAA